MSKNNKFSPEVREPAVRETWFNHQRLLGSIGDMPPAEASTIPGSIQIQLIKR
jgi:hypothetical protein